MRADARAAGRTTTTSTWLRRVLLAVLAVSLIIHVAGLLLGGSGSILDRWPVVVMDIAAVMLCVGALRRAGTFRWPVVLGAVAVVGYAAGNVVEVLLLDGTDGSASGVVLDVTHLIVYPLVLGILALMLRAMKDLPRPPVLESILGALATASVMVLVLATLLAARPTSGTMIGAFVHPVLHVLLISAIGAVLAARGLDRGPRWLLLVAGLVLFTLGDVVRISDLQGSGTGSLVSAGSAAGIAAVVVWVEGLARTGAAPRPTRFLLPEAVVPLTATVAALVVLLIGCQVPISLLAQILAACTLAVAAVPLVFRSRVVATLAATDELTGLPNRRALLDTVPPRLQTGRPGALFLMDLDRFKDVNDALGHDVGDQVVIQVGERFARQVRGDDILVRLGGDEFALFLEGVDREEADVAAHRLGAALLAPFEVGTTSLTITASIGIALAPANGTDLKLLMRKADIAMFRAKADRSGHHFYSAEDDDGGALKLRTTQELRAALGEDQFELHFQPKVGLENRTITSVEALLRWNHPVLGQLPPGSFLPLAEEANLMPELTGFVLESSVDHIARWYAEGLDITVAVNLSSSSIQESLPDQIRTLLKQYAMPPTCLILEITEDMLMTDSDRTALILRQLRDDGIQISIDDFGSGYSSLAHLRDLPVDEFKLDRSFISAMFKDRRAHGLVASMITMAHSLDLRVVAEGVDNRRTEEELRVLGCDLAQGFHFTKPLPAADVAPWIEEYLHPVEQSEDGVQLTSAGDPSVRG